MMKRMEPIGCATEFSGTKQKEQLCYGTFRGDMPNPAFRFNIIFVEHKANFPVHSHEYAELVIVLAGRGIHLTDQGDHPLEEGDVFVISGNHRHGFKNPQGLRLCNIMYDPDQALANNRELKGMMGYHALFELEPRSTEPRRCSERLHLSTDEMVYVTSLLSTLKGEFDGRAEGRQSILKNLFQVLVTYFCRLYGSHKQATATPLIRMARVMSHIQQHFRETLCVDDLARMAHLSRSQFQRMFKRTYQITPLRFILKVRMHEACEMLKDPNRDITNIAFDTGFSSSSFFATQFKQHMGESPSEYRRKKLAELKTPTATSVTKRMGTQPARLLSVARLAAAAGSVAVTVCCSPRSGGGQRLAILDFYQAFVPCGLF
jgi:AraC-like DNA-binding protein/quercetin dioxygenase-like cupin family protein